MVKKVNIPGALNPTNEAEKVVMSHIRKKKSRYDISKVNFFFDDFSKKEK